MKKFPYSKKMTILLVTLFCLFVFLVATDNNVPQIMAPGNNWYKDTGNTASVENYAVSSIFIR